ncbi:MAG: TM1812 family CRISPR-associated protein [Candidatus Hodarchaeota archaeon]
MGSIKMFFTVGTTPQAVANAMASHLLTLNEGVKVDCYFFMGSSEDQPFPSRTSSDINQVIERFQANTRNLEKLQSLNITVHSQDHELIDIYEHDLGANVPLIVSTTSKIFQDGDRVIFDITAGRKIMTASALLSIMILKQNRPSCSYEIAYYWLKRFTPGNLNKMLYELGFDAYETIFTPLEQLDDKVRMVRK